MLAIIKEYAQAKDLAYICATCWSLEQRYSVKSHKDNKHKLVTKREFLREAQEEFAARVLEIARACKRVDN